MNNITRIALAIGLITIIILSLYALFISSKTTGYDDQIVTERAEKDIWLSNDFDSPFSVTNTPFQRLDYYEPNRSFRIEAKFIESVAKEKLTLITNTGESQQYEIYGMAIFDVDGVSSILKLLKAEGSEKLFLPFMDATSGESTYGAGRYLDLDIPFNEKIVLDFNKAYNPYCAYTSLYSCPFPPKANILTVAINAGEKTYNY